MSVFFNEKCFMPKFSCLIILVVWTQKQESTFIRKHYVNHEAPTQYLTETTVQQVNLRSKILRKMNWAQRTLRSLIVAFIEAMTLIWNGKHNHCHLLDVLAPNRPWNRPVTNSQHFEGMRPLEC